MQFRIFLAALLCAAPVASAHGVQTQLTYDATNNRIDTRSIIYTSSNPVGQPNPIDTITAQRRAYVMPLEFSPIAAGTGWYARPAPFLNALGQPEHPTGPGPAWQYDDGGTNSLAGTGWAYSGSSTRPNLQNTTFTYKLLDGLKVWNGSAFVDPGAEQTQILASDGTTTFTPTAANNVVTRDVGPFGTLAMSPITTRSSTNNAHASLSIRLLGDGASLAEGDDGIYLLTLALSTTATAGGVPVGDSEPFYFVLTKNAATADAIVAAQSLGLSTASIQRQLPEPSALLALVLPTLVCRRRRK